MNMDSPFCISLKDVEEAHTYLQDKVHLTPVLTSSSLNRTTGRNLFFKCEIFQKTGSFKIRGALNAVRSISAGGEGKPKAVVTHSSGNHGQAVALAAKMSGIPAYVVVPSTAPSCKKAAILGYGAQVVECEPNDEVPAVNALVVPVGGGGMLAGIAVAVKALRPDVKVFAAEPKNADDCFQSKLNDKLTPNPAPPETIADAIKTSIGVNTWPVIRSLVDDVFTVSEEEIKRATQLVWERMKLVIEPTAGVGVAVVLSRRFQALSREMQNICVVLCGGNVDLGGLDWLQNPEDMASS
ncbi:serine racemase-like isoform X2 [Lissotriton helveticus]